ncbi:RNA-directed DNA polymerase from mobile element jockey-like [Elysia marginata]|uniref:RNA-directed DNA polymerase from mobile element jockey-like n=1 Tax=Elysia marginata TaxID=1093978 RepID=A0AAV4F3P3_9GAST|nr:RNA-directed DNA polymerase from mobile element jockey-like [Elysia marginata]
MTIVALLAVSMIVSWPFEEVRKSFNSLNNNKAPGEDEIHAELLKYGTPLLDQTISDIFNTTFNKHEKIDINGGVLIAIQKPGKKNGPLNNLRPITLLNSLRKALSVITLNRIRPDVERYLSNSQSGFRPNRSTADVVWTHKWLSAKTLKEDVRIKITGIDMSAAFDTIDRSQILDILKTIIKEDELRIVRFLLSNTEINTKINGFSKAMPFMSNVDTPQGDSLSPVLFTIYLENALREIRTTLLEPNSSYGREIPRKPLSLQILESRWKLFGHILRRHRDIPANKATRAYFIQSGKNHRGRPRTTLPTVLNRDLAPIDHEIRLHSSDELDKITALAQDRRQWHEMTAKIERAAEASQTENWDAPRH